MSTACRPSAILRAKARICIFDVTARKTMKRILIALVLAYRYVISPLIGSSCRFQPTCSQYAIDALKTRGVFKKSSSMTTTQFTGCFSTDKCLQDRFLSMVRN